MPVTETDDAFCRAVAALAGVVVVNVDYVVAPQYPFPAPPRQSYDVVRVGRRERRRARLGRHPAHGGRAERRRRSRGGRGPPGPGGERPPIALQVLHYPPLDLATAAKDKRAAIAKPVLRPWMGEVFDSAYVPDPRRRADRLVSPAHPEETADLKGIAPALIITAAHDRAPGGGRALRRAASAGGLTGRAP